MNNTLGAPSFARNGSGQAGDETSKVRPMTPLNAVPGLYSLSAMILSLLFLDVSLVGGRLEGNCHFLQARPERFDVIILVNQRVVMMGGSSLALRIEMWEDDTA